MASFYVTSFLWHPTVCFDSKVLIQVVIDVTDGLLKRSQHVGLLFDITCWPCLNTMLDGFDNLGIIH
jgi:hypothetical protein